MPDNLVQEYIARVHSTMPELPTALAERLKLQYSISEHDVNTVMSVDAFIEIGMDGERPTGRIVDYFERVVAEGVDAKNAINWYGLRVHLFANAHTNDQSGLPMSCWDSLPTATRFLIPTAYLLGQ